MIVIFQRYLITKVQPRVLHFVIRSLVGVSIVSKWPVVYQVLFDKMKLSTVALFTVLVCY